MYVCLPVIPAASLDPNKDTKIDSILESLKSEFLDILQQCTGTIQFYDLKGREILINPPCLSVFFEVTIALLPKAKQ